MVHRRVVLTGVSSVVVSALAGCSTSVLGEFGDGDATLSKRKQDIIQTYSDGVSESNSGTEAWNAGISLFNDSEYSDAVGEFESAVEHFETAQQLFSEAEAKALDIDQDESARLCADANERSGLLAEAAGVAREAAQAGASGEEAPHPSEV